MRARAILLSFLLVAPACVSKGTYDAALQDAAQAKAAHAKDAASAKAKIELLERDLEDARLVALENDAALAKATATKADVQKMLDEQTAMNQKLRAELEKLGKDVDALLAEKGTLGASLADAKKRLEELRKAQAAAEARAALYAELLKRLKSMVDAGELAIELREGRMVLKLPSDVLFDSGKADLKKAGKSTLEGVAAALKTVPRRFQVAGHTDDEPIKLSPYASNWELSTARALRVVSYLLTLGMEPQSLSAAGYGEFDPVAPNTTPEDRAKNRRIEITLQPQIAEMVQVPG